MNVFRLLERLVRRVEEPSDPAALIKMGGLWERMTDSQRRAFLSEVAADADDLGWAISRPQQRLSAESYGRSRAAYVAAQKRYVAAQKRGDRVEVGK